MGGGVGKVGWGKVEEGRKEGKGVKGCEVG